MNFNNFIIRLFLSSIVLTATMSTAQQQSKIPKAKQEFDQKATEAQEVLHEKWQTTKKIITEAADSAKKTIAKELEHVKKKFKKAQPADILKHECIKEKPELPAFNITNIYGKQLNLEIHDADGNKLNKVTVAPGSNFKMNTIPAHITASYQGVEDSHNGLTFSSKQIKGIKHLLLKAWLRLDKTQFEVISGIANTLTQEDIEKAKEAYTVWWKDFDQSKGKKPEQMFQEFKKSAKDIATGYKEVSRQALEAKKAIDPYIK